MKAVNYIILSIIFWALSVSSDAQNSASHNLKVGIPEAALLSINAGNSVIQLIKNSNNVAGGNIFFEENHSPSHQLFYTSIIGNGLEGTRTIAVSYEGQIPEGLNLFLESSECNAAGAGTKGKTLGKVQLHSPGNTYDIINNIGSCYTGNSPDNGHTLTFSITTKESNEAANLPIASFSLDVTYTLLDI